MAGSPCIARGVSTPACSFHQRGGYPNAKHSSSPAVMCQRSFNAVPTHLKCCSFGLDPESVSPGQLPGNVGSLKVVRVFEGRARKCLRVEKDVWFIYSLQVPVLKQLSSMAVIIAALATVMKLMPLLHRR